MIDGNDSVDIFSWDAINSPHCMCWFVEILSYLSCSPLLSFQAPATQEIAESLVDDFVVTESASALDVAIAVSAAVEPVRITQRGIHH